MVKKKIKILLPLSDMYTFYPCSMSMMVLWLNPGKNVKNVWLELPFPVKTQR